MIRSDLPARLSRDGTRAAGTPAGGTVMLAPHQVEELICVVSAMGRETITEQLTSFRGSFPVDFTREFLERQSVDRLRHIYVAVCLQANRVPEVAEAA